MQSFTDFCLESHTSKNSRRKWNFTWRLTNRNYSNNTNINSWHIYKASQTSRFRRFGQETKNSFLNTLHSFLFFIINLIAILSLFFIFCMFCRLFKTHSLVFARLRSHHHSHNYIFFFFGLLYTRQRSWATQYGIIFFLFLSASLHISVILLHLLFHFLNYFIITYSTIWRANGRTILEKRFTYSALLFF